MRLGSILNRMIIFLTQQRKNILRLIMKNIILACLLSLASVSTADPASSGWLKFKSQYGKIYVDHLEEKMRHSIFIKNKLEIEKFNQFERKEAGFELGLNHLADWTHEEYNKILGFKMPPNQSLNRTNSGRAELFMAQILGTDRSTPLPASVDWRQVSGRVTAVKDQGRCGSCWAFSTTGVLEGQQLNVTTRRDLIGLSEQNLVDCVDEDYGCNGGYQADALDKIAQEGGIMDDISYPYTAKDGKFCKFNKAHAVMTDSGHALLEEGNENLLKEIVARFGPVSVAIDSSPISFLFYKEGVFKSIFCKNDADSLSHALLIVGYGTTDDGVDYWLVKNSWNTTWGDKGYIKMARNYNNMCGIATYAIIPTFSQQNGKFSH